LVTDLELVMDLGWGWDLASATHFDLAQGSKTRRSR
jgi:hypothetical protein